ncbi:TIGR04222 domain-containing membrane protein [Streptosporangium sp. NPDC048865]|uniref:TIGR04222 domain-containing membrane protein n=1 Tax=Streptosporangium sp. NPDC048865 TaxID=3155766 RepID=UPI00342D7239
MQTVQIVVVFGVSLLGVAVLVALRLAVRPPRVYEGPELTPYELALLAGGRSRVADTALASLTVGGPVRARRNGSLTRVSGRAGVLTQPVQTEILGHLDGQEGGVPVWVIRDRVARGAAVTMLIARLRDLGLIDAPGSGRADPTHPNRAGKTALAHYRLRHREDRSLPPRAGDRVDHDELNILGVALYGLKRWEERRLAATLSMDGPPPPPAPRRASRRHGGSDGSVGTYGSYGFYGGDGGSGGGDSGSSCGGGGGGGGGGCGGSS